MPFQQSFANRMRSALTMLGILIGTAAVILLVGVGKGISDKVQDQIKSLGTNSIYVIPERNSRGQDRGGTSSRRVRLTQNDVEELSDPVRASAITPRCSGWRPSGHRAQAMMQSARTCATGTRSAPGENVRRDEQGQLIAVAEYKAGAKALHPSVVIAGSGS